MLYEGRGSREHDGIIYHVVLWSKDATPLVEIDMVRWV